MPPPPIINPWVPPPPPRGFSAGATKGGPRGFSFEISRRKTPLKSSGNGKKFFLAGAAFPPLFSLGLETKFLGWGGRRSPPPPLLS